MLSRVDFMLSATTSRLPGGARERCSRGCIAAGRQSRCRPARSGKVLMLVVVSMPAILAIVGLVFDTGLLMTNRQNLQHAADAASTAAAMDLLLGNSAATAQSTAANYLQSLNGFSTASITTNIPPQSGVYAGNSAYVEVLGKVSYTNQFMQLVGAAPQSQVAVRSVAGCVNSTAGAAIVALDPTPSAIAPSPISSITLPAFPAIVGGLEILGSGTLSVNGAVLVNTTWGGVDQNGNPAGSGSGPPYGISCTPLVSTTSLLASNIRVVGGVDKASNYGNITTGQPSPLRANALAVTDPLESLPTPCTGTDPANVSATNYGGVTVTLLPIISPTKILQPGVYDWIEINSGTVIFSPGVYIICGTSPVNGTALSILGGAVTANGVLFYITNTTSFDAATGAPDSGDGASDPGSGALVQLASVVITGVSSGSSFSPLAGGPFNGLLLYQRRADTRPIVVYANLPGSVLFEGTVYAKWGAFFFSGSDTVNLAIAAGTIQFLQLGNLTLSPPTLFAPAQDVYLVE